jgi:hypothetical protein
VAAPKPGVCASVSVRLAKLNVPFRSRSVALGPPGVVVVVGDAAVVVVDKVVVVVGGRLADATGADSAPVNTAATTAPKTTDFARVELPRKDLIIGSLQLLTYRPRRRPSGLDRKRDKTVFLTKLGVARSRFSRR